MGGGMGGGAFETYRMMYELQDLIINSVDYLSWELFGGEATIRRYGQNQLIISQTIENHEKIKRLVDDLMTTLSQQVALEIRFLLVTEKFLEDIGLDLDFTYHRGSGPGPGTYTNPLTFNQQHSDNVALTTNASAAAVIGSGYGGGYFLDDLEVSFLIRATQRHEDGKVLNAPKVTVLNGRPATITIMDQRSYVGDYDFEDITTAGLGQQAIRVIADPVVGSILDGVILDVVPVISKDKRYVALQIVTMFSNSDLSQQYPVTSPQGDIYNITLPLYSTATIRTRVNVPDKGTLLIGGQKLSRNQSAEEGVPILSKIPILGRIFRNRSEKREQEILLILVKPIILLQEESEEEAIAMLKEGI